MGANLDNFQQAGQRYQQAAQRFILLDSNTNERIAWVEPQGPIIYVFGRPLTEQDAINLGQWLRFVLG